MRPIFSIRVSVGPTTSPVLAAGMRDGVLPLDSANTGAIFVSSRDVIANPAGDPVHFFNALTSMTISASGLINSGVVFTGPTPPDGWDMPADPAGTWIYKNHPDSHRYGLIGALVTHDDFPANDEWFLIGNGIRLVGQPSLSPPPSGTDPALWKGPASEWKRLWLACNRPIERGLLDNGNGDWTVSISVSEFDASDVPACTGMVPSLRCSTLLQQMSDQQTAVSNRFCPDINALNRSVSNRNIGLTALEILLGVDLTVLTIWAATSGSMWLTLWRTASQAATFVADEIASAVGAAFVGGEIGAISSLAGEYGMTLGTLITVTFAAIAALAGLALPVAASGGFWTLLAYLLIVAAALVIAGAIVALLNNNAHDFAQMGQDADAILNAQRQWDSLRTAISRFCCPQWIPPDALNRPACGGA